MSCHFPSLSKKHNKDLVIFLLCFLFFASACSSIQHINTVGSSPNLGIIADCQYADQATKGVRFYATSDKKLSASVDTFNQLELSQVFHLGDFIDVGGMESVNVVLPIMDQLISPHTFVLGNHDFEFPDQLKKDVPAILGLKQRYFAMKMAEWKFLILDGNDVSLYAWAKNSKKHHQAVALHQHQYSDQPTYNGALGEGQLAWLRSELEKSEQKGEKVILLCHFPILPIDSHVLWNAAEVLELISPYSCVKAWLNGHNHAGDYAQHEGIHFVTFKGMVDTPNTSFATIELQANQLIIKGYGRELDRSLLLR